MRRLLLAFLLSLLAGTGTSLAQLPPPSPESSAAVLLQPTPLPVVTGLPPEQSGVCPAIFGHPEMIDPPPGKVACPTVWFGADYLMWWERKGPLAQPLVTSGPTTDPFPGALDQRHTQVLFGGQGLNYGMFSGLRLNGGLWLDPESRFGIQASGFQLERRSVAYNAGGGLNGQPFLAEPFTSAQTGNQNVYFISQNFSAPAPGAALTGSVGIASTSRLWSWEINQVFNLVRSPIASLDLLLGYRQLNLSESLTNSVTVTDLAVGGSAGFATLPVPPPFYVHSADSFQTRNRFQGGQFGGRVGTQWGLFSLELLTKIGLGVMNEVVTINGLTWTNAPLPSQVAPGGIYAQLTNIGRYSRNPFTVVPEFNGNLGVDLTGWMRARVGYTFLYASSVARPGSQINPILNRNLVPIDINYGMAGGPARPAFQFEHTTFWAQGINFGLEFLF